MAVRANTVATFRARLEAKDTFTPIAGREIEFMQFQEDIGDFRTFDQARTGANGEASVSHALPAQPGRYRYRTLFRGDEEFRRDQSPEERVDIE